MAVMDLSKDELEAEIKSIAKALDEDDELDDMDSAVDLSGGTADIVTVNKRSCC